MAVNYDAIELGKTLGQNIQTVNNMNEQVFETENITTLNIKGINTVQLKSYLKVATTSYAADSFIIDSDTQGIIDSAVFKIDGGYSSGFSTIVFYPEGMVHNEYFLSSAFVDPASTATVDYTNGRVTF